MQVIKRLLPILMVVCPSLLLAQSTLLPQGYKHQQLIDRMEIRFRDSALSMQQAKPFDRKGWVEALEAIDPSAPMSVVDAFNIESALMNNQEWVTGPTESFASKRPFLKTFYKTRADLLQVNVKDFFLAINPMFNFQVAKESGTDETLYINSRGARARGLIAEKIGFDFYLAENQEKDPWYVRRFQQDFNAVPGAGYYKTFKTTGYDYLDARGSIFVNATKYINIQFGYDKNFIGNGYRSLFLSDFSNNYLFLKLNTRIWKLNYQNIFMELTPSLRRSFRDDQLLDKKYAAMHHLSYQPTEWLNVGLFESVIFGRRNKFDFTYLVPVIFLRSIEQQNGSADNANIGFDVKANVAKHFQFYTQVLFDEFKLSEMKSSRGWWANKYAIQLGAKYIDAFGIPNLDLQAEYNKVRPFTYSHNDSLADYSHYNQSLAHPMGANLREFIGIVRYQPIPRLQLQGKLIAWQQGKDSAGIDFGSNILRPYSDRPYDYGWTTGTGRKATGVNASLYLGYEILENLFIDGMLQVRNYKTNNDASLTRNTTMFSLGLRMNMYRREFDY